jgi:Na+/H+-dicarboxylate symporter
MYSPAQYSKTIFRIAIGIVITSLLGILAIFYNLDPYKDDWFIWVFYFLLYSLVFGGIVLAYLGWTKYQNTEHVFRESINEFILTSSFVSAVGVFLMMLWQSNYLNPLSVLLVIIVCVSYGTFRYIE